MAAIACWCGHLQKGGVGGTTLVYGCVWGVAGGTLPHYFMEERIVQCGMVWGGGEAGTRMV